jgi:hypothetical protein
VTLWILSSLEDKPSPRVPARWLQRVFLVLAWIFGIWCALFTAFIVVAQAITIDPITRAVLRMALGVVLLWILGGGILSLALRRPLRSLVMGGKPRWQIAFVLGSTAMALLEEAVTTSMTNLAPAWGVPTAQAHITASGNYLDVVLLHSVIVFVPMFIAWSLLLKRYNFTPTMIFVLYGLTGLLGEWASFGVYFIQVGFWIYVYGLMVFLPTQIVPPQRIVRAPGIRACVLALVLPLLCAIPVAIAVQIVHHIWFSNLP